MFFLFLFIVSRLAASSIFILCMIKERKEILKRFYVAHEILFNKSYEITSFFCFDSKRKNRIDIE